MIHDDLIARYRSCANRKSGIRPYHGLEVGGIEMVHEFAACALACRAMQATQVRRLDVHARSSAAAAMEWHLS